MQQSAQQSHRLLTARDVQQLLHIDRSTVYRMAGDGRLAAIRVGRQLRFPADALPALMDHESTPGAQALDPAVAGAVVEVAADLLGVTMVVTDMSGQPLTEIANPSAWFGAGDDRRGQVRACLDEWRVMADDPDLAPRFVRAPMGFECARAFVRVGSSLIGMVLAGGISAEGAGDAEEFHNLDGDQRAAVLHALPQIAGTLAARAVRPVAASPVPTS